MIIPFFIPHAGCPHQCVFCSQRNITGVTRMPLPSSLPAVIRSHLRTRTGSGPAEVAFYGGSFTALPVSRQRDYLEAVQPCIDAGEIAHLRISTRPDGISPPLLALLEHYRVGTVELGAQSFSDDVLCRSERGHTAGDTVAAVRMLRERGFRVGLQLMPGLPGDSRGIFIAGISTAVGLRPDLVRIYPALVIKDTPLAELYRSGSYEPLSLDDAVELCRTAVQLFEEASIPVVRIGLQPTEELQRPGVILAGPWHPSFRQLVDSSRYLDAMRGLLSSGTAGRSVTFLVHPSDLSSATGQRRRNLHALAEEFGITAKIVADHSVPKGAVRTGSPCLRERSAL